MAVRIPLTELVRETRTLASLARRDFFDREYTDQLGELERKIESLKGKPEGTAEQLVLREITTRFSEGEYEAIGRKGQPIRASISGVWDVRAIGKASKQQIEFSGKASLVTTVRDKDDRTLVTWKTELGDEVSPGCYFHFHFRQPEASPNPLFPKPPGVPRFPSVFVTPMAALEHTLGELFQERWSIHVSANSSDATYWKTLQARRLHSLFNWQARMIENSAMSPWMALKAARPGPTDFGGGKKGKK